MHCHPNCPSHCEMACSPQLHTPTHPPASIRTRTTCKLCTTILRNTSRSQLTNVDCGSKATCALHACAVVLDAVMSAPPGRRSRRRSSGSRCPAWAGGASARQGRKASSHGKRHPRCPPRRTGSAQPATRCTARWHHDDYQCDCLWGSMECMSNQPLLC